MVGGAGRKTPAGQLRSLRSWRVGAGGGELGGRMLLDRIGAEGVSPQRGSRNGVGFPRFSGQTDNGHAMTPDCPSITTPTKIRRRFTPQQKDDAVALCLQAGLSSNAIVQRLGLPSSSLARWVRQTRIDRG